MVVSWPQQLRTRTVLAPLLLLAIIFVASGILISNQVDHVFQSYQDRHLSLSSNLLMEKFDNYSGVQRNRLKLLAVRPEVGEGYFVIKTEDNAESLGKVLKQELLASSADAMWVFNQKGSTLFQHGPILFNPYSDLSDTIIPILDQKSINDPQNQLDGVVVSRIIHHQNTVYLVTLAPLLDVENIVGVIVMMQHLDDPFLFALRNELQRRYLEGTTQLQLSLTTDRQVINSTLAAQLYPTPTESFPASFNQTVGEKPYRHVPLTIANSKAYLMLSFDTSEVDGLQQVIRLILAIIFITVLGLVVVIILFGAKQAALQQAAQKAYEDLSRSEVRLRTLYDYTRDAVMLLDEKGFFDCNKATLDIFGCESDTQFYVKHPADLSPSQQPCGTDSRVLAQQRITQAMQEGSLSFEWVHLRSDTGKTFFAEVSLTAMELDGRQVLQAVVRDISSRKQAETALRESEEKLRKAQKMEAIGMLTGGIAHDFNNILASMLGYTELAITRFATDRSSKLHHYLTNIHTAGHRAKDLVAQMLAFSRGQESAVQQVAIVILIKEVIKMVRATFPSSISITFTHDEPVRDILSDPVQCHQVILNLLVNARDAMQDKGRLDIQITNEHDTNTLTCSSCHAQFAPANMVKIIVRDSGSGMSAEVIDKIFQPFYTTKEVGKGSGMGLAVIHGILHTQNAHLIVSSQPDVGSEFALYFPSAMEKSPPPPPKRAAGTPRINLSGTVLVVDDEKSVLEFLREYLEDMGLSVIAFTGSKAALDFFRVYPERIDLMITDQTMPELTGVELVNAIHALNNDLPVIMCTGFSRNVDESSAQEKGIQYFLKKPIELAQLTMALHAILANRNR